MTPTTIRGASPIIDAYLAELDAATAHLAADERFDIVTSIEEHIADHVGPRRPVPDDDARRVLADLGPVASIVTPTASAISAASSSTPASPMTEGASQKAGRAGHVSAAAAALSIPLLPLFPISSALGIFAVIIGIVALVKRQQRSWACLGIALGILTAAAPLGLMALYGAGGHGGSSSVTTYPAEPVYDGSN